MKAEEVFKRYDIRGEYPEEVDEEFAEILGKSFGSFIKTNYDVQQTVVSKDNKNSSNSLKSSFINGLNAVGVDVLDAGTGPTDYAAFTGNYEECFSVEITSSHMPANFNGFKFMYPEGNGFLNDDLYEVQDIFLERRFKEFETTSGNKKEISEAALERYKKDLTDFVNSNFESCSKKVVLDTLGGATDPVLKEILEDLGHEVIDVGEVKNYTGSPYRNPPNPKPEYLGDLEELVTSLDADIGLATDMDGDRTTVYYDNSFLDGNEIFGILSQLVDGDVVGSIDTSEMVEELLTTEGRNMHYTRVGDPFVMDKSLEEPEVDFAGEPNGHYAFLEFLPYNSGTLSLSILAGLDIDNYLENLQEKTNMRKSVNVDDKEATIDQIKNLALENYDIVSTLDGVKFASENVSVLVRPSGSSPKVRVVAEGDGKEDVEKVVENVIDHVK